MIDHDCAGNVCNGSIYLFILPKTVLSVDIRFSEHKAWFAVCITINSLKHKFLSSIFTV